MSTFDLICILTVCILLPSIASLNFGHNVVQARDRLHVREIFIFGPLGAVAPFSSPTDQPGFEPGGDGSTIVATRPQYSDVHVRS